MLKTALWAPAATSCSRRKARNGRPLTSASTFGRSLTTDFSREPTPPARITAVTSLHGSEGSEGAVGVMGIKEE